MFLSIPACPIGVCSIGRFLRADNNNLKYLGITALAQVVSVNPVYATEHKALVIDCLDDPDETLKRKVGGLSIITDRGWPWRVMPLPRRTTLVACTTVACIHPAHSTPRCERRSASLLRGRCRRWTSSARCPTRPTSR